MRPGVPQCLAEVGERAGQPRTIVRDLRAQVLHLGPSHRCPQRRPRSRLRDREEPLDVVAVQRTAGQGLDEVVAQTQAVGEHRHLCHRDQPGVGQQLAYQRGEAWGADGGAGDAHVQPWVVVQCGDHLRSVPFDPRHQQRCVQQTGPLGRPRLAVRVQRVDPDRDVVDVVSIMEAG